VDLVGDVSLEAADGLAVSFPRSTDTRPEVASATGKDVAVPSPHPAEFRRRAVELARERAKPIAEVAEDLCISESCLRSWMAQADIDERGGQTRLTSDEKKGALAAEERQASTGA